MTNTIIALTVYFLLIEIRKSPERILTILLSVLFTACCSAILVDSYYLWFLVLPLIFVYATTVHNWYKQRIYNILHNEYSNRIIDADFIVSGEKSLLKSNTANLLSVLFASFGIWFFTKYPDAILHSVNKNGVILFLKCFGLYSLVESWTFSVAQLLAYHKYLKEIKRE